MTAVEQVDCGLTELAERSRLLLHVTPVNGEAAFAQFETSGFEAEPVFHYRPLSFDPAQAKRDLHSLPYDSVEDEALAAIFTAKRNELDSIFTLLEQRDTPGFRHTSQVLFGEVGDELLAAADAILAEGFACPEASGSISAQEFANRANAELDRYRELWPGIESRVEVRSDLSGLMVVNGNLLIGADATFRHERVVPLIQHEVGTHVVTYENGKRQPLSLFRIGLANYDETQEALAVFAEYVVGALEPARLSLLAIRVVAARRMAEGASFVEVFRELRDRGCDLRSAWNTTMRAFRCGGTPKDAMYLRGLSRLLDYLDAGHSLEPLLVGKLPLEDVLLVERLMENGVLQPGVLRPRWLTWGRAEERIGAARAGLEPLDLLPMTIGATL